jgi:putative membrane protein
MIYNGGFLGMHLIWWFIWIGLISWIFATPYNIPGQRFKKDTAFDILGKRFAAGELTDEEYKEKKRLLEIDSGKVKP